MAQTSLSAEMRIMLVVRRLRLKCDGTCAETRLCLWAKRTSPFKSAGASVQSTAGSRGVSISGSNAGYTMFRGSVKSTRYPLHSPVFPSLPLPCVTAWHHISTGLYVTVFAKLRFSQRCCWALRSSEIVTLFFEQILPDVSKGSIMSMFSVKRLS